MTLFDNDALPVVGNFRHRGHHRVSRIESFSDAVFGFSLTLLVVSLQVPHTFDDLLRTMAGFPGFAISFALLAQIWYFQYLFFRRYGLTDRHTIVLNIALLFVVVFYTYPLKFLFGIAAFTTTSEVLRPNQIWQLLGIYAAGYAAMFVIFLLLYRHALAQREFLSLTKAEVAVTQRSESMCYLQIGIAAGSVAIAGGFTAIGQPGLGGLCGGMIYPIGISIGATLIGRHYRKGQPVS